MIDRETIIRLAQDSGLLVILEKYAHEFLDGVFDLDMCGELERFAALVAAHEREECAKVCETEWTTAEEKQAGTVFAAAIRSRT